MPKQKGIDEATDDEVGGDAATAADAVDATDDTPAVDTTPTGVVEEAPSSAVTEDDAPVAPPFGGARTEKVRFLESVTTDVGSFTEGQTADVPAGIAGQLVSDGKAEYVT